MKTTDIRPQTSDHRHQALGFTLIELLVAMTILLIITMIVAQIFQQANRAWDTGMNKVEVNMRGRAVVDFIARELSQAVYDPVRYPDFAVSGNSATFWMLKKDAAPGARAVCKVNYNGIKRTVTYEAIYGTPPAGESADLVKSGSIKLPQFDSSGGAGGGLPDYVTVTVTITNSSGPDKVYSSIVYFKNRDRYRF